MATTIISLWNGVVLDCCLFADLNWPEWTERHIHTRCNERNFKGIMLTILQKASLKTQH